MRPTLRDGARLLVRYDVPPSAGQVVVVRFPDGTLAVKRATVRDGAGWWVERDNPAEGIDSWHVGGIPESDVLGRVLVRLPGFTRRVWRA